jgi:hypothetical protein
MRIGHNSTVAERIVARKAMARGVVVLDKSVRGLESALRDANILVVKPEARQPQEEIKKYLLPHRILVTTAPARFLLDAAVYEYGVLSLGKLKAIDTAPSYGQNKTVQLLSRAMSRYKLWVKGAKFLLELRDNGKHQLQELL